MKDTISSELRRLRAAADDARERLGVLEQRHADALEHCFPGPSPRDIDHARRLWVAAEAQADAAARMARKAVKA